MARLPTIRPLSQYAVLVSSLAALAPLTTGCVVDSSSSAREEGDRIVQKDQELINGRVAAPYHFRSTVGIANDCTAAKVGPNLFLTAAHCVADLTELRSVPAPTEDPAHDGIKDIYTPGEVLDIRYGIRPEDTDEHYYVPIEKVHIHPTWLECSNCAEPVYVAADIAVIEVSEEIETENIPEARVELGPVALGTQVVKVGMGCQENTLIADGLEEYKSDDAWTLSREALWWPSGEFVSELDAIRFTTSYLITAGHRTLNNEYDDRYASLCTGDSGGPLYLPNNGDPRIVGVNSYYQFNGIDPGVSVTDWHTKTSFDSRFSVGKWLYDLKVNTVGGGDYEGDGGITMERWNNVGGWSVSQIPTWRAPDSQQVIEDFEIYPNNGVNGNNGDNYGVRVRGYLTAPKSGSYRFWIAGDDQVSLSLGTSEDPGSARRIAYHTGYTDSRGWRKYPTQQSNSLYLVRGRRYYIEALMKEGGGEDNLAVGWNLPGEHVGAPMQVIPAHQLSPIVPDDACSCPKGCNAIKAASPYFLIEGFDDSCYFFEDLGGAVASSSMDEVNLNGLDIRDRVFHSGSYPARRDGGYYLYLKSDNHLGLALATD